MYSKLGELVEYVCEVVDDCFIMMGWDGLGCMRTSRETPFWRGSAWLWDEKSTPTPKEVPCKECAREAWHRTHMINFPIILFINGYLHLFIAYM